MEQIRVMEKPDWISWDEVQQCIHDAQLTNKKKGFDMSFGHKTGDELRKSVGENGYCFVVLNESNKVIATMSLRVSNIRFWWYKGEAGFHCCEAVLPDYRGTDAYFDMHAAIKRKERELGIKLLWFTTAERNKVVLRTAIKTGCKMVRYASFSGCDYYSVIFAKWLDEGCPYSDATIKFMYYLSKIAVKILYKPGHIKRFVFLKKENNQIF